jgi:hypothetical protein
MYRAGRLGFIFVVSLAFIAQDASTEEVPISSSGSCSDDTCDIFLKPQKSLVVIDRQRKIKQVSSIKYVDVHEGGPVSIELSAAGLLSPGAQQQQQQKDPADIT